MDDSMGYLQSRWESLKSRNRWTCIEDDTAFLEEVNRHCEQPPEDLPLARLHMLMLQCYNRYIYATLLEWVEHPGSVAIERRLDRVIDDVRAYVIRKLPLDFGEEVAKDLAQELLFRLIARYESIRKPESVLAWINNQIWDLSSQHTDPRRNLARHTVEDPEVEAFSDPAAPIERQVEARMHDRELYRLLRAILTPFQLQVVIYSFWDEQKPGAIAERLQVKVERVRLEKSRALQKLRGNQELFALWER